MNAHKNDNLNTIGKVSHYFMTNSPLSILLLIATLVFGLVAFFLTPKQYNPEIVRPAFALTLTYSGATTEQTIDKVVYELVEKVKGVPGVDDVYTEVTDGTKIVTTVIFEVGYDTTEAKVDLLAQLNQHSYLAQGFISTPSVVEINPETIPVLQVVFGSPSDSIAEVRKKVIKISRTLSNVPSVSGVSVVGGYAPALVVDIDPVKLSAYDITTSEVITTLRDTQTRFLSSGFTTDTQTLQMVFDGRVTNPTDIGTLLIQNDVRIRNVASVYEGATGKRSYVLHKKGTDELGEVVMLAVSKVEGSSAFDVTSQVLAEIDTQMQKDAYGDLSYTVVGDDGVTAQNEIYGLTFNLISSIAIVVLVLLLFLSMRAALVVLVAIPMTLLIVFGLGYLFDQTINRITLFALILSLGLLVDSAIVVVENIFSSLKKAGDSINTTERENMVAKAVHEVGIGLVLSAVTSVIVFLPMNYITGMMGPYMGPIAFFVPAALIVSLVIAIVITPFLALHLLKLDEKKFWLARQVDRLMQNVIQVYEKVLLRILDNTRTQKNVLLSALFLFSISLLIPFLGLVHFQMLPKADRDQFYVYIDLPVQTSIEATKQFASKVATVLVDDTDIFSTQVFIAQPPVVDFNGMFKGAQARNESYQATLRVNLTSSSERSRSSTDIATDVRAKIAKTIPDGSSFVRIMEEPPGPPVRATLVAKVSAEDMSSAHTFADKLFTFFGTVDGVVDRYTSEELPIGQTEYILNHKKAEILGVTPSSLVSTMQVLHGSVPVTEYLASTNTEYTPVIVSLTGEYKNAPADLSLLSVRSQNGTLLPILSVLETKYVSRSPKVYLEDATPVIYVTGEVEGRSVVYVVIENIKRILKGELEGYKIVKWNLFSIELVDEHDTHISLEWGGEWEMTLENFRDLGVAMAVALMLVYAVLVAQYNSFSKPAFILVTVPLSLIGILWGFLFLETFFGIYLTATALIGFIALIGIVVNNAIIYLEYVEQAIQKGHTYKEALLAAGSERLQPIFLTSLTTILGSLTIASDPVWSGLAWSIIFGLSLSTILTLIVYPTLLMLSAKQEIIPK